MKLDWLRRIALDLAALAVVSVALPALAPPTQPTLSYREVLENKAAARLFLEIPQDAEVFLQAGSAHLADSIRTLLEEFRLRYEISYIPSGVGQAGWHAIELAVKTRRVDRVSWRRGYMR